MFSHISAHLDMGQKANKQWFAKSVYYKYTIILDLAARNSSLDIKHSNLR